MFSVSQIHPFSSTPTTTTSKTKFGSEEAFTFLQNCTSFRQLKQIHAKIIRSGLSHDQLLLRKLLQFSSTSGNMDYAALVFRHQIPSPLTFTWNLMIRAYTFNASPRQALLLFTLMTSRGFPPDKFTFPFVIKACTASSALRPGDAVHGLAIKADFSTDIFVQNTLMDFYFKCGDAHSGRKVFDKMRVRNLVSWTTMVTGLVGSGDLRAARAIFEQMPAKNVVSWTIMIDGYVADRQPEEALKLFRRMQLDNVSPNEFTLVSLLKACTELGSLKLGRWVHDFALKNGFELDVFFGTALIDTKQDFALEINSTELVKAQAHIWKQIFNFINSMSLKCAIQLGIPDAIHSHGKPMTLSQLISALPIHQNKKPDSHLIYRLMRILVNSGFFVLQEVVVGETDQLEEGYVLTTASIEFSFNFWHQKTHAQFSLSKGKIYTELSCFSLCTTLKTAYEVSIMLSGCCPTN